MSNLVNITITEEEYQKLLLTDFKNIPTISVKIIPDDSLLKDDLEYQKIKKEHKRLRDLIDKERFNKLTNK